MSRVRDVVFDLGGVLVDWDPRHLFLGHLGANRPAVESFLSDICSREWHQGLDAGGGFELATEQLAAHDPEHAHWIRAYSDQWDRMFAGPIAASMAALEELARRDYRLHALSNYPAEKIAFLYATFPFMRRFHTVVVSGLLGITKPDAAIYRYLLDRIGAETCVFIDDRIENVLAAEASGLRAIHFEPPIDADVLIDSITRRSVQ